MKRALANVSAAAVLGMGSVAVAASPASAAAPVPGSCESFGTWYTEGSSVPDGFGGIMVCGLGQWATFQCLPGTSAQEVSDNVVKATVNGREVDVHETISACK